MKHRIKEVNYGKLGGSVFWVEASLTGEKWGEIDKGPYIYIEQAKACIDTLINPPQPKAHTTTYHTYP